MLYKHIIQVENKDVGLKVGGHKHTIAPPIKKVGGHMPPLPPRFLRQWYVLMYVCMYECIFACTYAIMFLYTYIVNQQQHQQQHNNNNNNNMILNDDDDNDDDDDDNDGNNNLSKSTSGNVRNPEVQISIISYSPPTVRRLV